MITMSLLPNVTEILSDRIQCAGSVDLASDRCCTRKGLQCHYSDEVFVMTEKKVAIKMVVDGKERDVSFEELALSNNLAQEALVRLLIDKKLIEPKELLDMMERVKKERYRTPDQR